MSDSSINNNIDIIMPTLLTVAILLLIVIVIAVVVICNNISQKREGLVLQYSERIHKVEELNKKYTFNVVEPRYMIYEVCNSKRVYDKIEFVTILKARILSDMDWYDDIVKKIESNRVDYEKYQTEYNKIYSTITEADLSDYRISLSKFQQIEEKIFRQKKLMAVTDINIDIVKSYTSPKGQNSYENKAVCAFDTLKAYISQVKKEEKNKQTHEYQVKMERSRVTDSIRYDIMKRDKFRCQICGASANDGVKLHVDHIIPVSKGGKSEISNLRTLCDRCNLGKSNKL